MTDDTKKEQDLSAEPENVEGSDKIQEEPTPEGELKEPVTPSRSDELGEKPLESTTEAKPATGLGQSMETPVEPKKPPKKTPPKPSSQDGFKPHYKKEARLKSTTEAVLFAFLFLLGAGLIALGVATFVNGAPFRLEVAATVIICLALLGFLRKTLSIEVMVGLAAAAIGLVLGFAFSVYGTGLVLFGAPANLVLAVFFCLCLAALFISIWLMWPRFFWAPIVASVLVLYAAITPIWALAVGVLDTTAMLTGPSFLSILPIFIRPGFLLAQVILPLGVILLLVLQVRTLAKPQYASHWGFVFWAVCLLMAATIGLTGLERDQKPVFPKLTPLIARVYPVTMETAAKEVPVKEEPAPPETPEIAQPVVGEKTEPEPPVAPEEPVATPDKEPEKAATEEAEPSGLPPFPTAEETKESSDVADVATPIIKKQETEEPAASTVEPPAQPETKPQPEILLDAATLELHRAQLAWLEQRVTTLESEVDTIKQRMEIQDRLIRALFDWLSTHFGFGMGRDAGKLTDPSQVPGMPFPMLPAPLKQTLPETKIDAAPEKTPDMAAPDASPSVTAPDVPTPDKPAPEETAPPTDLEETKPVDDIASTPPAPVDNNTDAVQPDATPENPDAESTTDLEKKPEPSVFLPNPDLPVPDKTMMI